MDEKKEKFLRHLLETYKEESLERLKVIYAGLVELEKKPDEAKELELTETLFREFHSLKGASRSVNLSDIEAICHALEGVFLGIKQRTITLSKELPKLIFKNVDTINELILNSSFDIPGKLSKSEIEKIVYDLSIASEGKSYQINKESLNDLNEQDFNQIPDSPVISSKESDETNLNKSAKKLLPSERFNLGDTIKISIQKLDSIFRQAEELLQIKLVLSQRTGELKEIIDSFFSWEKEWQNIQKEIAKVKGLLHKRNKRSITLDADLLKKISDFFDLSQEQYRLITKKISQTRNASIQNNRAFNSMVDNLLEDAIETMMSPFSLLFEIYPKMVRDLSTELDKEIDFIVEGGEIEIDRRILNEIKDPIIHIIRNSIEHGIERREQREKLSKPIRGKIKISITKRESGKIEMIISDDGSGIDYENVKNAAINFDKSLTDKIETLSTEEVLNLIYQSGISTSSIVTELSGRGLGLAIAKEKAEKIGGTISCESIENAGVKFTFILPNSLAIFRGVIVGVGGSEYIIPTNSISKALRIKSEDIKTVENKETIIVDEAILSFVRMSDILELPDLSTINKTNKSIYVLVLNWNETKVAFAVDEIDKEQEVLIKDLGKQLIRVRNISGGTISGTGKVNLILNVYDLIRSAVKYSATSIIKSYPKENLKKNKKSILVAEDSITSRTLLKNILETSGYNVKTAVDGMEALTLIRTEHFDAVVSDLEMPRMSGFELTSKIRSDTKYSNLPVILVTGLESREDRERGIEVGANAYIIKSSFDSSNLLEVLTRFV